MITILRKHQRVLMLIIALLTIIAFIWLYNPADTRELGSSSVATVYGRNLSQADIEREVKSYQLALAMGQFPLLEGLGGIGQDENRALQQFIWNRLVIQHQAKALGVEPTDSQVAAGIKAIPAFQSNGQFDPSKYKAFVVEQLGPRGFTEMQLENVVRDALRFERLKQIVGAPVAVSEKEILETARIFEKVNVQEIRFSSPPSGETNVTDEEVKNFYEQNKPALVMPETRVVDYVKFEIPKTETPLEGRTKVEALQKAADLASAFADLAAASSFEKEAEAGGKQVQRSPDFDRSGAAPGGQEDPQTPAALLRNLAPSAFLLTEKSPVSDVIQSGDAFYVLKLAKVTPERPMTIEEARPLAVNRLGTGKAERLLRENTDTALAKVREAMAAGKSFQDAATEAGLKVRSFNYLLPNDQKLSPEEQEIAAATLLMEPGQLSGMIPGTGGGFAVFLASREPLDEAGIARKPELATRILETKRRLLFMTWLSWARDAAKITVATQPE